MLLNASLTELNYLKGWVGTSSQTVLILNKTDVTFLFPDNSKSALLLILSNHGLENHVIPNLIRTLSTYFY